jgi:hypothetical protein
VRRYTPGREWERTTRSIIDGTHLIERINARGALIKVLDKLHLDLTTPLGSRLHRLPPIGNGRVKKSSTDHAVVSWSSQTALEKSISRTTPDKKRVYQSAEVGPYVEKAALPADQMPTCSRIFEATATAL